MSRVAMRSEIERICEIIDDTIRRAPRRGTGPAAPNCSDRVSWLMRRTGPSRAAFRRRAASRKHPMGPAPPAARPYGRARPSAYGTWGFR
ncbi:MULTISPECIES: hypothetical protein [unclassified Streptomyces]|uniref:hypothetical protein n=1 Tax=unclassified Streptomyces TaxID=2593676 RepID=UPI00364C1C6E